MLKIDGKIINYALNQGPHLSIEHPMNVRRSAK
jgi:hypothetical protein